MFESKGTSNTSLLYKVIFSLPVLYCLSLPFEGAFSIQILGNSFQLPEAVFISSFPFLLYYLINQLRIKKIQSPKLNIAVAFYILAVGLSFLHSESLNALGELAGMFYFFALFYTFSILLSSRKKILKKYVTVFKIMLVAAGMTAIIGMLFSMLGFPTRLVMFFEDYPIIGDVSRASGFLRNPILLADILGFGLLILLGCEGFRIKNFLRNKRLLFSTSIILSGLILTLTKSILLVFGVGCLAYFKIHQNNPAYLRIAAISIAASSIFIYLFTSHFFIKKSNSQELETAKHSAYGARISYPINGTEYEILPSIYTIHKYACLLQFSENPFFGIGGNSHIRDYHRLYAEGKVPVQSNMTPHSTYFGALAELGIIGFSALLYLLFSIWKILENLYKANKINHASYIGFVAVFIYILLQAVTMDIMNIRHYWLALIALSIFQLQSIENDKKSFLLK